VRHNGIVTVLRVALAQLDCTVGDLDGNAARVLAATALAQEAGAELVAFPELMITGYPPEDLVLRESFRAASRATVHKLAADLAAAGLDRIGVIVGYLDELGGPRNAAAFLLGGRVQARYFKHHLPNYGVFDERRYFVPGERFVVVRFRGHDIALTVCEDLWHDGGPFAVARAAGVELVVNINASPFERDKDDVRLPLVQRRAAEAGAPIVYVNTVGAQDELVFDGDSMVVGADGAVLLRAPQYVEDLFVLDLPLPAVGAAAPTGPVAGMTIERDDLDGPGWLPEHVERPQLPPAPLAAGAAPEAQVWGALVTGLRDYVTKNGFGTVVVGMSGGIDSAVVAAVAADALGGDAVYGVSMPSGYSSSHSRTDARDLAERLGAHYREVPIAPLVDEFVSALALTGVAEENVQARVRGTTLMALSNAEGHLVLATGNKSELAVGYSTIYGDAVGGFAPLKDVPKTLVWQLARWRNAAAEAAGQQTPIPPNSIAKPPSAELRPGQLDTDSLPDYEVLDAILQRYVDSDASVAEIVAEGFDADVVQRIAGLVDRAEWKRRQYPIGPKISLKSFGRDRRLPITSRWRETAG
jgi:NAD+ synthase (glutamine-hydrolysing)